MTYEPIIRFDLLPLIDHDRGDRYAYQHCGSYDGISITWWAWCSSSKSATWLELATRLQRCIQEGFVITETSWNHWRAVRGDEWQTFAMDVIKGGVLWA